MNTLVVGLATHTSAAPLSREGVVYVLLGLGLSFLALGLWRLWRSPLSVDISLPRH